MRPGEAHGINYYFVDRPEFQRMVDHDDFLEHATIFDNWYGTSKTWVEKTLAKGIDVILEIDWQGHQQIKELFPESIGIFILPPSLAALQERLIKRNQDHPDVIKKRLADVRVTASHFGEFEYLVINDDFSVALESLKTIVLACRLLLKRQVEKYKALIADLA
jgi:guanylate kinase